MEHPEQLDKEEPNIGNIVKALSDYKMSIISKNTLLTQDPVELKDIRSILRFNARIIKNYILRRVLPPMLESDDTDLYNCIQILKPMLDPWNVDVSILAKYWCEKLFESDSFSFSTAEHMVRIMSKSNEDSIMPAGK